jgi:hypothetical protein
MELMGIESSKVINLFGVFRPEGQVYQLDFVKELATRYSFAKFPAIEELLKREYNFAVGKFQDIQIQDFAVYGDGVLVSSASDTDKLVAFIDDVKKWSAEIFGLIPTIGIKPELYFESTLVVKADVDLAAVAKPAADIVAMIQRAFRQASSIEATYYPTGFIIDITHDGFPGRRKPIQYMIERRIGVPSAENQFHCRAPLPTKAHLATLRAIEDFARRA